MPSGKVKIIFTELICFNMSVLRLLALVMVVRVLGVVMLVEVMVVMVMLVEYLLLLSITGMVLIRFYIA